jgi:hypothetical protein
MLRRMELERYELRDPRRLMEEIAREVTLAEDTSYVALVHHPSTDQRLVQVTPLDLPALLDDDEDISETLRDVARSFGIGWRDTTDHLLMTVIVRPGRTVFGPNESVWFRGWRYANHFEAISTGDLILVTEHGWLDFMTDEAGHEPRMGGD